MPAPVRQVNFPGSKRARRFLADFYLVELEFDPIDKEAKDLLATGGLGLAQLFAQSPEAGHHGVHIPSRVHRFHDGRSGA